MKGNAKGNAMKVIFLEGRTDLFYIEKVHKLIGKKLDDLFLPCGGASEIWPMIYALKQNKLFDEYLFEVWVDNDDAGHEAYDDIHKRFEDVHIRVLAANIKNGSIEDMVGFLAPETYEIYNWVKSHSKKNKKEYAKIKSRLYAEIISLKEVSQDKQLQIKKMLGALSDA